MARMASRYSIEEQKKVFNELRINKTNYKRIMNLLKKGEFIKENNNHLIFCFNRQKQMDLLLDIISKECYKIGIVPIGSIPEDMPIVEFVRKIKKETGKSISDIDCYIRQSFFVAYYLIYNHKDHSLKNILFQIHKFVVQLQINYIAEDYYNLNILKFDEFLNYLEKDENYLDVVLILRIVSDALDLPLKGKSLEEYRRAIIRTCKEILKRREKEG